MAVETAKLPRVNWHIVGALGSLLTQAVMAVAALSITPPMSSGGWIWYGSTYLVIGGTYILIRRLTSPWSYLIWPAFCLLRLLTFNSINHPAAVLVPGFITICFLFAGLTQPQGRSLLLLPLAVLLLNSLLDLPPGAAIIRLSISVVVWIAIAELPAYLLRQLVGRQQMLMSAVRTDVLTGARNRFGLADTLREMQGSAYLVIVDLDKFKQYNDSFGHTAGDEVLTDFAGMLQNETRKQDVVVRYGGEEFLVVIGHVDQATAEKIVERWAAVWRKHASGITFSAGITDLSSDRSVLTADEAMYRAKAEGRDRAVVRLSTSVGAPL